MPDRYNNNSSNTNNNVNKSIFPGILNRLYLMYDMPPAHKTVTMHKARGWKDLAEFPASSWYIVLPSFPYKFFEVNDRAHVA